MRKKGILLSIALALFLAANVAAVSSPVMDPTDAEIVICEGASLSYVVPVTDSDSSSLSAGIYPDGDFYARVAGSQESPYLEIFSGNLTKSQANKIYSRTIYVSDGEFIDTRDINITVLEVNNPPLLYPLGAFTMLTTDESFTKQLIIYDAESGSDPRDFDFTVLSDPALPITIDPSGVLTISNEESVPGLYKITVCATDRGIDDLSGKIGLCSDDILFKTTCQNMDLAIVTQNSQPTILSHDSTNLSRVFGTDFLFFEVYTFDPDGTVPSIQWTVDDELVKVSQGKAISRLDYSIGCGVSGRHHVLVEISDGILNDSYRWSFDVIKTACHEGIAPGPRYSNISCEEQWGCNMWSSCQNANLSIDRGAISQNDLNTIISECERNGIASDLCGYQIRTCEDTNQCSPSDGRPDELQSCFFVSEPSCSDGVQNCHGGGCEFSVDCGGPCGACATCSDGIKNQGEDKVDCGGPCSNECPIKVLTEEEKAMKRGISYAILALAAFALFQMFRVVQVKKNLDTPPRWSRMGRISMLFGIFTFIALLSSSVVSAEETVVNDSEECFPEYVCGAWSDCEDGMHTRSCEDILCGRRDILERDFCDNPSCTPRVECGAWSECFYTDKASDLISGEVSFGGYRTRVCEDKNGCVKSFIQEGACEESYELMLSPVTECDMDFLAVIDPTSEREIAKIDLQSWKDRRLDLSFVQGKSQYCPSCYNTVRDGNEEGVDCGGDCKPCRKENRFLLPLTILLLWIGSTAFSVLSVKEVISYRKLNGSGEGQ